MTITVKARVVGVRPRADGSFGVTLGPGPNVFWYETRRPPKLGELVVVEGAEAERRSLTRVPGGVVTILDGGAVHVEEDPYPRRVVAPEWVRRVHGVMRRPLFPFQAEGAGWIASRLVAGQGSIMADDAGCGKTPQLLAALAVTRCFPAIVVCPASVKRNWAREARFLRVQPRVSVLSGGRGPIPASHLIILNYSLLRPREMQLKELGARCIVFDEAHVLKEPTPTIGHRAAVATRLAHVIRRSVLLTGTPLLNRPQELWRLLYMLDPRRWSSFEEFRERYCTSPAKDERVVSIVTRHGQVKRIDELRAYVMPYMFRRLAPTTLGKNLPSKHRGRVLVDLDSQDMKSYQEAERDVVSWLRRIANNETAERATRGQAVVKLTMLRRIAAMGKLRRAVGNYLETWFENQARPLVIFAYHRQVLAGVTKICQGRGIKIATISGKDSDQQRQEQVDLFQAGKADVFLAPIKSAGVGLNLQRGSDVLFLERLWTPALMHQAESRCHRLGQMNDVTIAYMDAIGTIDLHVAAVLEAKQMLIDSVVDDIRGATIREQTIETIDEVIARLGGCRFQASA